MKKTVKSIPYLIKKWWLGLLVVVGIALFLRLVGVNWDSGQHLHPDERFLTMVAIALKWPKTLLQYFDPVHSPLNPYNQTYKFFVYGRFPVIFTKFVSDLFGFDNYSYLILVGRILSALFDTSIVIAIFLGVKRFLSHSKNGPRVALYSALMYAAFVLPIQQSHYFTSDTFVTAFLVWSLVAVLFEWTIPAGILFGLALGSKINALYMLPLILILLMLQGGKFELRKRFMELVVFFLATYVAVRIADPYLFQSANFFLPYISAHVLSNIRELQGMSVKGTYYPPGVQWYTKTFLFGLYNIFWYGVGPVFFTLSLVGVFLARKNIRLTRKHMIVYACVVWCLFLFTYQSLQFAKSMRYYYILYPFIAIGAGYALSRISVRIVRAGIFFIGFLWTAAFVHIYMVPHSRITASQWMYEKLPDKSIIAMETWDDPLPLLFPDTNKQFKGIGLDVFWPDTTYKWNLLAKKLSFSDYLSLSSNRAWASIMSAPDSYPIGSKYYQKLLAGKLGFKEVARFTSSPMLDFGIIKIQFPDDQAEEAFTVYDHPQVIILQKQPDFDSRKFLKSIQQ